MTGIAKTFFLLSQGRTGGRCVGRREKFSLFASMIVLMTIEAGLARRFVMTGPPCPRHIDRDSSILKGNEISIRSIGIMTTQAKSLGRKGIAESDGGTGIIVIDEPNRPRHVGGLIVADNALRIGDRADDMMRDPGEFSHDGAPPVLRRAMTSGARSRTTRGAE